MNESVKRWACSFDSGGGLSAECTSPCTVNDLEDAISTLELILKQLRRTKEIAEKRITEFVNCDSAQPDAQEKPK